jgi:hypothetical protein
MNDDYEWIDQPIGKSSIYWWLLGIILLVNTGFIIYFAW